MKEFNFEQASAQAEAFVAGILKEMADGKRKTGIEWGDEFANGKLTLREMITSADGGSAFLKKITYDVYQGREATPLLYKSIYQTKTDPTFPEILEINEMGPVRMVFLEYLEGSEIKFGDLAPGTVKTVKFKTYAAGIQYTENMIEYNQTWKVSDIGTEFGESYNKLLNHLHLYPIVSDTFVTTAGGLNGQKKAQKAGTAQLVAYDTSIAKTLRNALTVLPKGAYMLINSADRFAIEDAIKGSMYADLTPSTVKTKLNLANIIEYDGTEITVGAKTYEYPGVVSGDLYLIAPTKKNYIEYIKHDLRITSDNADLSRLIMEEIVGRARRAVAAANGGVDGAVKVKLA